MKKILLLVAVVAATFSLNAQRSVDISTTLNTPAANAPIMSSQAIPMNVTIENVGTDSVLTTDTLTFILAAGNPGSNPTLITSNSFFLARNLLKDSSVTITFNTNGIMGGQSGTNPLSLCAIVVLNYRTGAADSARDNSAAGNNRSCNTVTYTNTASVSEDLAAFKLSAVVYPNPINGGNGTISYVLSSTEKVSVKLFDITGREVLNIFEGTQEGGTQSVDFNTSQLKAGVYFYQLQAGDLVTTDKVIIK